MGGLPFSQLKGSLVDDGLGTVVPDAAAASRWWFIGCICVLRRRESYRL